MRSSACWSPSWPRTGVWKRSSPNCSATPAPRSTCAPPRGTSGQGSEVNYATVVAGAVRRGETALGYKSDHLGHDAEEGFTVLVNPPKSRMLDVHPGDRVVVLAES